MRNIGQYLFAIMIVSSLITGTFQLATSQSSSQSLSISPNQGPVGTIVEVKGEGFRSMVVNFNFAGKSIGWTLQVSNTSGANTEFLVPNLAPGEYSVVASDSFGGYAEATFTVTVRVPNVFDTDWQQKYGNQRTESVSNLVQANDGGFAFLDVGWGHGFTFTPASFYKVNSSGVVEWKKSLGSFWGSSLVQTSDGGYSILGEWSTYGTTYENTPTLVKTDFEGNIQWVKNYSSSLGHHLLLTNDGGFAMMKGFPNLDFPPHNPHGDNLTATLTKTNSHGVIQWSKNFSQTAIYNTIDSMVQTSDHGYVMVGTTSFNGTSDTPNLYIWLIKTDTQGNLQWSRLFGEGPSYVIANQTENAGALDGINRRTTGDNEGVSVTETSDGGFVVSGIVYPARDYSWWGFSYGSTPNMAKTLLVKTDANGNTLWNQTFDGYEISPIIQTSDGGLVFAGSTGIIKTDANGNLQWTKDDVTFPSLGIKPYLLGVSSLIETSDGALAGIGVGTLSQSWQGNIYLFKTKSFLPLPTPSPMPTVITTPMLGIATTPWNTLVLVAIASVVVVVLLLLLYIRHRKTANPVHESMQNKETRTSQRLFFWCQACLLLKVGGCFFFLVEKV